MTSAAQAKQKLADLTSEVAQASAEVEAAREAVSASEATERDVERAIKARSKAEARHDQGAVDLKVATRREAQEAAHAAQEAARIRVELDRITRTKHAEELARWRSWLKVTLAQAQEFDARIKALAFQLPDYRQFATGEWPSKWQSWGLLSQALDDQIRHTPEPRPTNKEA